MAEDARTNELSEVPELKNTAGKKVLIIDDTSEIRMIVVETLNLFGFTPLAAEDGETGIKMAIEQQPDMIICDINMPNVDGYATLTAIRQNPKTSMIPFIFLSGASDKINVRKGMELGADDYLTKPFTYKELLAAVNARLQKQAEVRRQSEKKLDELRGNITLALPHELRTPLNGILGLAALLMEDYASLPPEEVLESARYIHESALRLHRLIENFLVYSQIELMASESKKIVTSSSTPAIEGEAVITETAQRVAARFKREEDLQLSLCSCTLLVPLENFQKVVEELTDNAFKFSERGSPICVSTSCDRGRFNLAVADRGRGMSAEQIANIAPHIQFERRTFEQQGAGLGLIIAKRMTELLDGKFLIESKVGQGTAVKVDLPMPGV